MITPPEYWRYPETRDHFDRVYDLLVAERGPRASSPLLDVGVGDGAALAAVVAGTELTGVAVDLLSAPEWQGPDGFRFVRADAATLPFPANTFPTTLTMETIEWFADPSVALRDIARVTSGAVIVAHTDWRSLWFDSDDPETSQEFTRLFAGPPQKSVAQALPDLVETAGLRLREHVITTVRGDVIAPDTYARHLLALLREWLVIDAAAVRARRFDDWRTALAARNESGEFAFSVDRHIVVADAG